VTPLEEESGYCPPRWNDGWAGILSGPLMFIFFGVYFGTAAASLELSANYSGRRSQGNDNDDVQVAAVTSLLGIPSTSQAANRWGRSEHPQQPSPH
jgi:hypothetical protein